MKRMIYAACAAATLALALPAVQSFADTSGPSATEQEQGKLSREEWMQRRAEIVDARLIGFKASLSPDERSGEDLGAVRNRRCATPPSCGGRGCAPTPAPKRRSSPIDRMREISKRMGERSTTLSTIADAAAPLYASLDAKQKVIFDATLRGFVRAHRFGPGGPDGRRWERRD